MKTIKDFRGNLYALDKVVAVLQGGTPHRDLPLPGDTPVGILVLESGARVETLIPYPDLVRAWNPPTLEELAATAKAAAQVAADAAAAADSAQKAAQAAAAPTAAAPAAPGAPGIQPAPPGLVDAEGTAA